LQPHKENNANKTELPGTKALLKDYIHTAYVAENSFVWGKSGRGSHWFCQSYNPTSGEYEGSVRRMDWGNTQMGRRVRGGELMDRKPGKGITFEM